VSSLLSPTQRDNFDAATRQEQDRLREQHGALKRRPLLSWSEARANRPALSWTADSIAVPSFTGVRTLDDVKLEDLVPYIDWTLFFATWDLKGRFPAILDHPQYGAAAREVYDHARRLLDRIVADRLLTPRGVYGFWPANAEGEDIVIGRELTRFNMLRQQEKNPDDRPNLSLADFIAPRESGVVDYIGAFAVTAGIGATELAASFERHHDDYQAIIVKALADRLAEAFAEYLHARARKVWGYGANEQLTAEDLIGERYRGIRPAFGYPACPDHSEKGKLFALLGAEKAGMQLTESFMMAPAASVSGLYFANPEARYFTVGRLGPDQVEDYARRKGMAISEAERWLAPNLAYEPVTLSRT
jgi:5-methyltetrahydrofolate--homocysteine methyltransferase